MELLCGDGRTERVAAECGADSLTAGHQFDGIVESVSHARCHDPGSDLKANMSAKTNVDVQPRVSFSFMFYSRFADTLYVQFKVDYDLFPLYWSWDHFSVEKA